MSLNETLANTGKQVATQAVDTAIDTAVDKKTCTKLNFLCSVVQNILL